MNSDAKTIIRRALADKSKKIYLSYWLHFVEYCRGVGIGASLPINEIDMVNFLSHLLLGKKYCTSTITSHVSALSYIHKLFGLKDFSKSFLVHQFLKGAQKASPRQQDKRLPITYDLLQKMIEASKTTIRSRYERVTFATMCIVAFYGFLRVGEMCVKAHRASVSVIQRQDVQFIFDAKKIVGTELCIQQFKHSTQPVTLFLPINVHSTEMCATKALRRYFDMAKHVTGPLFQMTDKSPITYTIFSKHLHNVISYLGYDAKLYTSHSFRIGAATHAAKSGFSEDSIKKMGRWKSNAIKNYVRLPCVSLNVSC